MCDVFGVFEITLTVLFSLSTTTRVPLLLLIYYRVMFWTSETYRLGMYMTAYITMVTRQRASEGHV